MSYDEFLDWSTDTTHAEWVEGEVVVFMPPKQIHQLTLAFIHHLLALWVDLFGLGRIVEAPFEMRAVPGGPAREPDLLFVKQENLGRLTKERLVGPADLIVEIVSRESVRRDRHDKWQEYAASGVPEYWVVDPREGKRRADFYRLGPSGQYELFATEDDEWVESPILPGFRLRPDWLWQVESLAPQSAFFEMRGLSPEQIDEIQRLLRGDSPAAP